MTDNNSKLRAVLLSALMVLSVFGATVAFTGGAAASASTWSQVSSDDVETGQSSYSQDLVFTAGFDSNGTENATLDLSNYPDGISVTGATVSDSPAEIDVANENLNTSNDAFTFDLISTNQNGVSGDVTITLTLDTTGASATQGVSPTLSAAQSGADTSFSFDVVEPDTGSSTGGEDSRAGNADGTGAAPTDGVSEVFIFDGATVYKGEEDLTFAGTLDSSLTGVAGNAEGTILSPPVPQDQSEGQYTNTGESGAPGVTVNTPRVTELEVNNPNGADISGGSVSEANAGALTINADWNYAEAEDLELAVMDSSGLEITGDVIEGSDTIKNADGEASWTLDLSNQDAGEYTIEVAGTEDLDFGPATQTTTLSLNTDDDISLDLGSSSVTQGSNVQYTIRGAVAGDVHPVVIDANDLRDSTSNRGATQVFRNVGDVNERGVITDDGNVYSPNNISDLGTEESIDYLYAAVEIDDDTGVGVGSIDTQYLDDTSIDVDVYATGTSAEDIVSGVSEEDSQSLEVTEGEVTIDNPSDTYVVGSEVEVNGTAPSGLDSVALYARDQGDYELLESVGTISVDSDGTWSEEDVTLSEASDIFRITGTYRLGAIDAQDARNASGGLSPTLSTSDFNSGTSGQMSLRVTKTSLDGKFWTVNGQVAQETGTIDVNGTAAGADNVLIGFIGRRGGVVTTTSSVDSDDYTFDEDDIGISSLAEGEVHGFVYHIGQDDNVGDGEVPGNRADTLNGLTDWLRNGQGSRDGTQIWNAFESETVEDTASDDNVVSTQFRLADASTRINTVYTEGHEASGLNPIAVGETAMVSGQTNLQPEDNTITLELLSQDGDTVALTSTEDWSWDGSWSMEMPVGDDVATGNYTLEVDDGENTDRVDVQVVNASALENETTTPTTSTTTPTSTTSTTSSTEETSTTSTSTPTSTTTTSSGSSPGFGVGLALVALAGAALLALRREN